MQSPKFKSTRQTSRRRLSSCSQALNRAADFQFRAAANFESRISSCRHRIQPPRNFKSSGKLLVDDLSDCSQLRTRAATSRRTSNRAASFEFSPHELQIKRTPIEIRLSKLSL